MCFFPSRSPYRAWSVCDLDDIDCLVDLPSFSTDDISTHYIPAHSSLSSQSELSSQESLVQTGIIPQALWDRPLTSPVFTEPIRGMGYDQDRFVGPIKDGLMCGICKDVLEEPLQAPCEHAFCATCIHGWLVHERTCPEDRQVGRVHTCHLYYLYTYFYSSF